MTEEATQHSSALLLGESGGEMCKGEVLLTKARPLSLEESAVISDFCISVMFSSVLGREQKHGIYWLS